MAAGRAALRNERELDLPRRGSAHGPHLGWDPRGPRDCIINNPETPHYHKSWRPCGQKEHGLESGADLGWNLPSSLLSCATLIALVMTSVKGEAAYPSLTDEETPFNTEWEASLLAAPQKRRAVRSKAPGASFTTDPLSGPGMADHW